MSLADKQSHETMVAGYREMAENAQTEREALRLVRGITFLIAFRRTTQNLRFGATRI